jgi:hypothetical protein
MLGSKVLGFSSMLKIIIQQARLDQRMEMDDEQAAKS